LFFNLKNGDPVAPMALFLSALDWPQIILIAASSPFVFLFLKKVSFLKKQGTRRWSMA
jgi:hypothetical protein